MRDDVCLKRKSRRERYAVRDDMLYLPQKYTSKSLCEHLTDFRKEAEHFNCHRKTALEFFTGL